MSGSHLSKEFFDLVKAIGESKSKQEEDRIIQSEVRVLKKRLAEKGTTKKRMREFLIRMVYVEMLGHDASFGYVHAVQLTSATDIMQKRVGYMCAALTLAPENEFRFMMVNQLQKDMKSANMLECGAGLVAVCKLVTSEMVPAVLPIVVELLKHEQSVVRKKATIALHRCHQLDPDSVAHLVETFRRTLCDKDPAVMGAALCLLHELAKENPTAHKDLVPSYVSILKQITEHRLPRDFDYHRMPAPWIQLKLLKLLAVLGRADQRASEGMYEVLHEVMKRADTGINVGYAIIYECVKTVTHIYPNTTLLDAAAAAISRFITSDNHNLKYLGVTGLAAIVEDHPRYASEHQMEVMDCLEDPDETLKRKTLNLLFRMTNPVNAEVVVEKLLTYLRDAEDTFLRTDLVSRITQLAERYAPDNVWYVRTMVSVLELGGELVEAESAHNLVRLIAEGSGDDEDEAAADSADSVMRREACTLFIEVLAKPVVPELLLQVVFWTMGEYAYLLGEHRLPQILETLCEVADRQSMSATVRGYAIAAVMKISAQLATLSASSAALIDKFGVSLYADLQQRCYEFRELARNPACFAAVLPVDASCEDITDASSLGFLNSFVSSALANGADAYSSEVANEEDEEYDGPDSTKTTTGGATLRYDAYEKPEEPAVVMPPPTINVDSGDYGGSVDVPVQPAQQGGLNMSNVKSVWGATGYSGLLKPAVAAANNAAALPNAASAQPVTAAYADKQVSEPAAAPEPTLTMRRREPEQVPKPRELTEREKMAAALFGGVSTVTPRDASSSATSSAASSARRSTIQTSAPPASTSTPQTDLLGMMDFGVSQPVATSASGGNELLDFMGAGNNSSNSGFAASAAVTAMRPLVITTQEFGGQWGSHAAQEKVALSIGPPATFDQFVQRIHHHLGAHVVEIISNTQEAILAGSMVSGDGNVLLHAKLRGTEVDMIVRSTDSALSQTVSATLVAVLG